jgi:chorismate mutase/prephenate dehydratase
MSLEEHRIKIDAIDTDIIRLLNERADVVHEIGVIKKRNGLEIYAPEREEKLLRSLILKGEGGRLPEESIRAIYREIMSAALALEEDLKIAYLGPAGTWTHQAAIGKFGHSVKYLPQPTLTDVFQQVRKGVADYGVVPIDNSSEEANRDVFRLFINHPLKICAEISLPIEICLMSNLPLGGIRKVFGHPSILAASRAWFARQSQDFEFIGTASTSQAAEMAATSAEGAAVGGALAAEIYQLQLVAVKIQDESQIGRFSVIGHKSSPPTGEDLTLLAVAGIEIGKTLVEVLGLLEKRGVSPVGVGGHEVPTHGAETHAIIRIEVRGHADDPDVALAIADIENSGKAVTVIGSYPQRA